MKYKKRVIFYYIAGLTLAFVLLYWIGQSEQKKIAVIKSTGIETVGIVIDKGITRNRYNAYYSVHFEFEHNGKRIVAYQELYDSRTDYNNAIIGMKYKVKYLPENPKNGNALIFLDQPVEKDFENIEKEYVSKTYE